MLRQLIAYDATGVVVATKDHMVARDEEGHVLGLIDFEAHELAGGKLRDIWIAEGAVGSGTWPEWHSQQIVRTFTVELDANKRIGALVHKDSGHRRERSDIEDAIDKRIKDAKGKPADIRDLVGGPDRPLQLDENGRTKPKGKAEKSKLPVIRAK
jgi:hypothetical protein